MAVDDAKANTEFVVRWMLNTVLTQEHDLNSNEGHCHSCLYEVDASDEWSPVHDGQVKVLERRKVQPHYEVGNGEHVVAYLHALKHW